MSPFLTFLSKDKVSSRISTLVRLMVALFLVALATKFFHSKSPAAFASNHVNTQTELFAGLSNTDNPYILSSLNIRVKEPL